MAMFRLHFETEADWPAPRYQTRKSRLRLLILGGIFLFLALIAFILRLTSSQEEKLKAQLDALYAVSQNASVSAPQNTEIDQFVTRAFSFEESKRGNLILVNRANLYDFSAGAPDAVKLLDLTGEDYYVLDWTIAMTGESAHALETVLAEVKALGGKNFLLADRALRSKEEQIDAYKTFYDYSAAEACPLPEESVMTVCVPGGSDYHTGLSVHLSLYGGGEADADDHYATLLDAMIRGGFILRYPKEKEAVTRVTANAGQFRYVGKPHAAIMAANNWCLEEYHDHLLSLSSENKGLLFEKDGKKYTVYRIALSEEGNTDVPVPSGVSYSVSGDNRGGLIITVYHDLVPAA